VAGINFVKPEISFKRLSSGWVFRAPNPCIVGNSPHYLVSDDQKVRIVAALRTIEAVPPLVVITASIGAICLAVYWKLGDIGLAFLIVVLVLLAISVLAAIQRRTLKPILAEAPLTNERITNAEMRKADEDSTTPEQARWRWLGSAAMCVASFLIVLDWASPARPARAIFFALVCLHSAWQAVRWYRVSKRLANQEE
jgi:hypothetical protein